MQRLDGERVGAQNVNTTTARNQIFAPFQNQIGRAAILRITDQLQYFHRNTFEQIVNIFSDTCDQFLFWTWSA